MLVSDHMNMHTSTNNNNNNKLCLNNNGDVEKDGGVEGAGLPVPRLESFPCGQEQEQEYHEGGFVRVPLVVGGHQYNGNTVSRSHGTVALHGALSPRYSSPSQWSTATTPRTRSASVTGVSAAGGNTSAYNTTATTITSAGAQNQQRGRQHQRGSSSSYHGVHSPMLPAMHVASPVTPRSMAYTSSDVDACSGSDVRRRSMDGYAATDVRESTAAWVFGERESSVGSEVYKSLVNYLDYGRNASSQDLRSQSPFTPTTDMGGVSSDGGDDGDDGHVVSAQCFDQRDGEGTLGGRGMGSSKTTKDGGDDDGDDSTSLYLVSTKLKECGLGSNGRRSESGALALAGDGVVQPPSPFASKAHGRDGAAMHSQGATVDAFSFPVEQSGGFHSQETVAPLFGVGSWPAFQVPPASHDDDDDDHIQGGGEDTHNHHNVVHSSIHHRKNNNNNDDGKQMQGHIVHSMASPDTMVQRQSYSQQVVVERESYMYTYDEAKIQEEYEELILRVVHKRGATGFEYQRELPLEIHDIIAGRYQIVELLGQAAFSRAVQALDLKTGQFVCLKVVKNHKDYFDQSLDEIKLLRYVNEKDEDDINGILRLFDYFYYKEHLILVTELLRANLYEFAKHDRENNQVSYFSPDRVKRIAIQILEAVRFLHSLELIHADLKPENILMKSYSQCLIKVIDLGSSFFNTDARASIVQSRSYRAPEVILGTRYDYKIDIWSIGCILVELATGRVLFRDASGSQMLARMESILGGFPPHLVASGRYSKRYFLSDGRIFEHTSDKVCVFDYII